MTRPLLRRATLSDVPAILAIKERLQLAPGQEPARGGFLLGCSAERYGGLIAAANVLVMEIGGKAAGFAITLPDPVLRASELWSRRELIRWYPGEAVPPEAEPVAYFDQLAVSPDAPRVHVAALAFAAVKMIDQAGHRHLYATSLHEPVVNRAAFPFLEALGARPVGEVEEDYPGVGPVVSQLHYSFLPIDFDRVSRSPGGRRMRPYAIA
jgi:hypothetical protein